MGVCYMATVRSSRLSSPFTIALLLIALLCVALPIGLVFFAPRSEPSKLAPGYDPVNLEADIYRYQVDPTIGHIRRTNSDAISQVDLRSFRGYLTKAGPASQANFEKACAAVKYSTPSGYCSLIKAN